jgi:heme-degrading monooxygenase HmoA
MICRYVFSNPVAANANVTSIEYSHLKRIFKLYRDSRTRQKEEETLKVVLIDKFIVPEESKVRFLEQVHSSAAFLRTLPGFVEGFVYEKTDGESRHNVVTTAVWRDQEAFRERQEKCSRGTQEDRLQSPEIMKSLNVEIERGVYRRSSY